MLEARGLAVAHPGAEDVGGIAAPAAGPLDLSVAPGDWVAIAGGNGSGKTALLLALAGLAPPLAGQVIIDGLDLGDPAQARAARARIGVVFQEPETQFVTDRVTRELAFPLENLGWTRAAIDRRVQELLDAFGLEPLADAPPDRLSGGEMQRVALATAAAPAPRYYLLDEPASYLDPESRASLIAWTRARCAGEGAAVVWTECDAAECGFADRVLELGGALPPVVTGAGAAPAGTPSESGALLWSGRGLGLVRTRNGETRSLWGGLDLDLCTGDSVALVGANGSGKTALIDTLAGWLEPTSGRLTRPPRAQVGVLAQFPEFQLFAPTALEDVRFGLEHRTGARRSRAEADRASRAALSDAGLEPDRYADRAPESLSLGERRRLALAGVLVTEPLGLLLDEPTAGLDAPGTDQLLAALAEATRRGCAVLLATHDPRIAARSGARVLRLPAPFMAQKPAESVTSREHF